MKQCRTCGDSKPISEFSLLQRAKDGRKSQCKNCHRNYQYQKKYGITVDRYGELLEEQDGGCLLCGLTPEENGRRLAIDHNHQTLEVRGLLCIECNGLAGTLETYSLEFLSEVWRYVRDGG